MRRWQSWIYSLHGHRNLHLTRISFSLTCVAHTPGHALSLYKPPWLAGIASILADHNLHCTSHVQNAKCQLMHCHREDGQLKKWLWQHWNRDIGWKADLEGKMRGLGLAILQLKRHWNFQLEIASVELGIWTWHEASDLEGPSRRELKAETTWASEVSGGENSEREA